jgi:homocitrate synthase NifV
MEGPVGKVRLRDTTMREGLDVPGVSLDARQRRELLAMLAGAGVGEAELAAPGHFERDLAILAEMGPRPGAIRTSGLVYAFGSAWRTQVGRAKGVLDRLELLAPLAASRGPEGREEKVRRLREALRGAVEILGRAGAGFPHATGTEPPFLLEMCVAAVEEGADRITLYDTNGSADPWRVEGLVGRVREAVDVEICFHGHNDLGLATANSLAAVRAGASLLDVTVNGLGDRAGNASLEQVALVLHARGIPHGVRLDALVPLSRAVEGMTAVPVGKLAPVVGEYAFRHKSPAHLDRPELFEPFDPALVGAARSLCTE